MKRFSPTKVSLWRCEGAVCHRTSDGCAAPNCIACTSWPPRIWSQKRTRLGGQCWKNTQPWSLKPLWPGRCVLWCPPPPEVMNRPFGVDVPCQTTFREMLLAYLGWRSDGGGVVNPPHLPFLGEANTIAQKHAATIHLFATPHWRGRGASGGVPVFIPGSPRPTRTVCPYPFPPVLPCRALHVPRVLQCQRDMPRVVSRCHQESGVGVVSRSTGTQHTIRTVVPAPS